MAALKTILTAASITVSAIAPLAAADGEARYEALARCMAYFAVAAGMDGNSDVAPEAAARIVAIRDEFMFEASLLGHSDAVAHTFVVERLVEINRAVAEAGPAAVAAEHAPSCDILSASLDG